MGLDARNAHYLSAGDRDGIAGRKLVGQTIGGKAGRSKQSLNFVEVGRGRRPNGPGEGLRRTDKTAVEGAVDFGTDRVQVDALSRQKRPGFLALVDAGRLDRSPLEASAGEFGKIVLFVQRPGHASGPQQQVLPDLFGDLAACDDIGHREAAARLEDAKRLPQDLVLVGREIDHTVRNDHVDCVIRQWNAFYLALQKIDVRQTRFLLILAGERQHFIRHVKAIGFPARRDPLGRQQDIDASAAAQVEHDFSGP